MVIYHGTKVKRYLKQIQVTLINKSYVFRMGLEPQDFFLWLFSGGGLENMDFVGSNYQFG